MLILSTCFYIVKSKFDVETYVNWFKNLLTNVKKFKLFIYTNLESIDYLKPFCIGNDNITLIIKEFDKFHNFKYKDEWIDNQKRNIYLKHIDWKLQMIWAEKINFVYETCLNYLNYYKQNEDDIKDKIIWFGWCDIGYFRARNIDISVDTISSWPNKEKIDNLDINKIYYGIVNDFDYITNMVNSCLKKNSYGLPEIPIEGNQESVAGGFFLSTKSNIEWWKETFDSKLQLYFKHVYLVKDDQMIIINCISENIDRFALIFEKINENNKEYYTWFMFQRFLL